MQASFPIIFVNGQIDGLISPLDRGFSYGDGVFETVSLIQGQMPLWHLHRKRLLNSCQRLAINLSADILAQQLEEFLNHIRQHDISDAVIKITVTRGEGGRGYVFDDDITPTLCIAAYPSAEHPEHYQTEGVELYLCQQRLGQNSTLAGLKHLNKLEHVLARAEFQKNHYAEGLLLDKDSHVIEGTFSNVFCLRDKQLYTPLLDQAGVKGVMRELLITTLAPQQGLTVTETVLSLDDCLQADELFLTNSLFGVWPVLGLKNNPQEDKRWRKGRVTEALQTSLADYLQQQLQPAK